MRNSNLFNTVPVNKIKNTAFDLSHEVKSSFKIGQLIPFLMEEMLPGDVAKVRAEHLVRMQALLAPIMHRVDVYTHFFFVPNRLLWTEWEDFITGGEDGTLTPLPPRIRLTAADMAIGTLSDYIGLPSPPEGTPGYVEVSALPFRAYWRIYNDYYVDQNVGEKIFFPTKGGLTSMNASERFPLLRAWEKDYFTSALPFPQRYPVPVTLPVGGTADVVLNAAAPQQGKHPLALDSDLNPIGGDLGSMPSSGQLVNSDSGNTAGRRTWLDPNGTLFTDLSQATGVNINDLRRALSLQRWLETAARVGSRYIEQILGHFGVRSSDARLQRAEYLGGGKTPVVISQVEQTSAQFESSAEGHKEVGSSVGTLSGNGTSYGSSYTFKKRFEEHGFLVGIVSVLPKPTYQNGLHRKFTRFDKFDYYWPEFANLGEQEIKERELFLHFNEPIDSASNSRTFGYTPRYAEYRYIPSSVHGDFRETLNYWHMGRNFANAPELNEDFIQVNPDDDAGPSRVFAVKGTDTLLCQSYVKFTCLRKMPKYGKPGL